MEAISYQEDEVDDDFVLTIDLLFGPAGTVRRQNYRRTWTGDDYRFKCGKHKGKLLSSLDDEKYLLWCLNHFGPELPHSLNRALIDQFNSLHQ